MTNKKTNFTQKKPVIHENTSTLLNRISKDLTQGKIQLGILLFRLRRRSFGGLLFFLALLSLIPGISILSGISMMILGVQLMLGYRVPLLPRFMSRYSLKVEYLKFILTRTIPKIEKVEKYIKPRLSILTLFPFTLILGVLIFCLAITILIPLPFTNLIPAISALVISIAILERDGLLIIFAAMLSVFSLAISGILINLALSGLENAL